MLGVNKILTMRDAITNLVEDGSTIVMGAALEAAIPFAAGHEIIRQDKKNLTLIGPISDILFDQLLGAGCVEKVIAAWVGNVSAGLGHNFRRATEKEIPRPLTVEDHSNFTLALALLAGALGSPYIPTRTLLGTDILKTNPRLKTQLSPIDGEPEVLVPAINPQLAILHVQRADPEGNAHAWGNLGVTEEAALAADKVLVVTEEICSPAVIASDPNRVIVPGFKVAAVVCQPWGAHPSPVPGYYNRDHDFYHQYHEASRTEEGFSQWLEEWVMGMGEGEKYLQKLGEAKIGQIRAQGHRYSVAADFGY